MNQFENLKIEKPRIKWFSIVFQSINSNLFILPAAHFQINSFSNFQIGK